MERRETRGKATEAAVEMKIEQNGETANKSVDQEDEEEEDEPDLVASNRSILIGNQGFKFLQLGASGLRQELLRCQSLLLVGLKRRGSSYIKEREGRKVWENSVRAAEDIQDLRSAVQELEAVVRSVQEVEDENDEAEAAREKADARAVMLTEGWRFEQTADEGEGDESIKEQLSFIGRKLRRFFKGHGKSDGIIVGYLPSAMNEGMELWRMEHQDGDEEDLDKQDIVKSIRWFEENLFEDDEAAPAEDEEEEDDDEVLVEEVDEDDRTDGQVTSTLWPTAGVRARWLEALQRSRTVSEVAMALSSFIDNARAFGMMDEHDLIDNTPRVHTSTVWVKSDRGRNAAPVPGASPYKRKGKSSFSDTLAEGGRAQRAAAKRVMSYAE
jgi:hypothetical protein